jgi:hypothetical protein
MFAETLGNFRHSTRLNPESRSHTVKIWIVVFSVLTSCSLAGAYKRFRRTYRLNEDFKQQPLIMEAEPVTETLLTNSVLTRLIA